jgi:hypothetical protein
LEEHRSVRPTAIDPGDPGTRKPVPADPARPAATVRASSEGAETMTEILRAAATTPVRFHAVPTAVPARELDVCEVLDLLGRRVEALALAPADRCFFLNWADTARGLWGRGECGAALYQIRTMARKLDGWRGGYPGGDHEDGAVTRPAS